MRAGNAVTDDATNKTALRKLARAVRARLCKERLDFAQVIAGIDLPLPHGCTLAGYVPLASEADPTELMTHLGARGHRLTLPCILAPDTPLIFRRYREGEPLHPGPFGTQQPNDDAVPLTPRVVLVPLLAFDAFGWRLGYGGGYYDRTLQMLRARGPVAAIGIAFAGQEVESVPHEDTDQPLDAVLTEKGLQTFAPTAWCG